MAAVPIIFNLNNIVKYDDKHAWMVSEHQVASCRISDERADVLHKSPLLKPMLGNGLKVGDALYVCSEGRNLLRFRFDNLQPDTISIPSPYYDHETKMEKLTDGNILLFMQGMHLAILSPKTGKIKEMKVAGMPEYGNFDPAFAKLDSYGNVWLGTKRDGLYLIDMKKKTMLRAQVLNDTHIESMIEDRNRQLWVTTMRDAFFVTFKSKVFMMNGLLSASQDRDDWQFYNNSICLSPDGDVVFGSSIGCKFMPQEAMYTDFMQTPAGIHAAELLNIYGMEVKKTDGKVFAATDEVSHLDSYTFAYDENDLRFNFYYPSFSRRSALMCQYKLEGYDHDWQVPTFGKAIKEDKLQDVFKRYYQLADTQNPNLYGWGTGIGLYYVKRLVELHHGSIMVKNVHEVSETSAEASLRNGVEFTFCLPMDRSIYNKVEIAEQEKRVMQIPLSADCSMEAKPEEKKKMNRPKILVVDDDVDVAQYLRHIFASDYEVVNRYSAEEALADLEEVKPDLILSDIIMDKMSGYEFCRVLKNDLMFSHIPVILITAMSKMSEQIEGLKLGAVAYVTKPFDPAYLKALVVSQLQNMQLLRQRLGESTETESLSEKVADTLSEQDRKFMDELYRLMEKHSNEQNLSVSTMCKDMLISPAKFNYKVKELTGETPGIFFRKYKLNRAAAWLREGKYNVSEIAVLTGFSTAAHFSVAFKKQFGVSPSEYQ